eukprot:CAMPEP_0170177140 /NCGR_PEP_ID=MMETSP0040_2-20121228/9851_1 /TAXON_ID=641309 /ORGANISM="Lotharella oceanica, Strain CCMP622" /LENGTH=272 /DNA_ID=CAMNT_0010419675 /DNA_START=99 /DNA_END=915 /DNA_ORIENTATION=+
MLVLVVVLVFIRRRCASSATGRPAAGGTALHVPPDSSLTVRIGSGTAPPGTTAAASDGADDDVDARCILRPLPPVTLAAATVVPAASAAEKEQQQQQQQQQPQIADDGASWQLMMGLTSSVSALPLAAAAAAAVEPSWPSSSSLSSLSSSSMFLAALPTSLSEELAEAHATRRFVDVSEGHEDRLCVLRLCGGRSRGSDGAEVAWVIVTVRLVTPPAPAARSPAPGFPDAQECRLLQKPNEERVDELQDLLVRFRPHRPVESLLGNQRFNKL